jgi:biopolymer transport protein ExbD
MEKGGYRMNRKWLVTSVVLIGIVLLAIFIYFNQLRYPALPADVESTTSKEAVQKLNESDQPLVQISKDNEATWYIMKNGEDVNKHIEQLVSSKDWVFKEADGNSLFFEKDDETLIVSTEMWTNKYRLVKVPAPF